MEPGRSMATLRPCAVTGTSDPAATTSTAATATMRLSMTDLLDLGWRRRARLSQEARHGATGLNFGRVAGGTPSPLPPPWAGRPPSPKERATVQQPRVKKESPAT